MKFDLNPANVHGCSQDFSRGTHIFSNLPLLLALLCLLRRQAWVKMTCSRFIPSRLLSERIFKYIIYDSNENQLLVLMCEKRVCCFENLQLLKVKKKTVRKEKYSKESKRVKRNWDNSYCRCCCFNFYTFFF